MKMKVSGIGPRQCYFCRHTVSFREENSGKVHYHRFPLDVNRSSKWVSNGNFLDLRSISYIDLNKKYYLCDLHFTDDQFVNKDNTSSHRLVWNATPTEFKIITIDKGDGKVQIPVREKPQVSRKKVRKTKSANPDSTEASQPKLTNHDTVKKDPKSESAVSVHSVHYQKRIAAGLLNACNTCFINAGLQALYNVAVFRQSILTLSNPRRPPYVYQHIGVSLKETFLKMAASNGEAVMPNEVLRVRNVINPELQIGEQDDVMEFLLPLIAKVSNEYPDSRVAELFNFDDLNLLICSCGEESYVSSGEHLHLITPVAQGDEPIFDIDRNEWVSFKSLNDAVSSLFVKKKSEVTYCIMCKQTVMHFRKRDLVSLPEILVIQLLRYVSIPGPPSQNLTVKNGLDISPMLTLTSDTMQQRADYHLLTSISHIGSDVKSGHYFCQALFEDGILKLNDHCITSSHVL